MKGENMANNKQTSSRVATTASKALSSSTSSPLQKSLAASALAQSGSNKQTGKAMETKASQAAQSKSTNSTTKTIAGSLLSQSNKKP
jgi:hypothetical protein